MGHAAPAAGIGELLNRRVRGAERGHLVGRIDDRNSDVGLAVEHLVLNGNEVDQAEISMRRREGAAAVDAKLLIDLVVVDLAHEVTDEVRSVVA